MSHTALIMVAPCTTVERLNDERWANRAPDRIMYDAGSLRFLPNRDSVPLLVNHDEGREIGRVNSLMRLEWTDGPWIVASATITDPPAWLKRGTAASFECMLARRSSFTDSVLRSAYVTEVSVLSPGVQPAEPLARVVTFQPAESAPAERERVIWGNGQLVRRYFPTTITVR